MHNKKRHTHFTPLASPWLIIGVTIILGIAVVALSVRNIAHSEEYMANILLEKGGSLIKAFEAGARTGMRGNTLGLQMLLEEMADQPDIDFIALADRKGVIVAHNDAALVGKTLPGMADLEVTSDTQPEWKIFKQDSTQYFVVYRIFSPFQGKAPRMGHMGHNRGHAWDRWQNPNSPPPIIFVGFDIKPFENARKQDRQHTMIMAAIVLFLGLAGFISLLWAQKVRQARKELESTQALSDEIVSNLPEGLVVLDANDAPTFMNTVARAMLGANTNPTTKHINKATIPLPEQLRDPIRELDTAPTLSSREMSFGTKNSPVPATVNGACITGEDGTHMGKILLLHDISEVRRLEKEIRRREKLAAIGSLAAGVAHEIRNPLSSIKGYATYFGTRFAEGSDDREAARIMVQEVDRLNRVISELIGLARPSDVCLQPYSPEALADKVLRLIRQEATSRNVELRFIAAECLPKAMLDPDRITQALLNICLNALEAMEKGGILTLSVDAVSRTHGNEALLHFKVRDTGTGISPEHLRTIFDPYFTTKGQGTGLGLAIVHKIVEAHGGEVTAHSTMGEGSEITVILPITPQNP